MLYLGDKNGAGYAHRGRSYVRPRISSFYSTEIEKVRAARHPFVRGRDTTIYTVRRTTKEKLGFPERSAGTGILNLS